MQPGSVLFALLLAAFIVFVVLMRKRNVHGAVILGWLALFMVLGVALTDFYITIPARSVVVGPYGERARFEQNTRIWTSDPLLQNAKIVSFEARHVSLDMSVSPITDNPKVRQLKYHLVFRVGGSPEQAIRYYQAAREFRGETDWFRYRLYEFNEKNSRELAQFYNPLDSKQQAVFYVLVHYWLWEDLDRVGIRLESAKFSLQE